ncbi:hypothetical protein QFC21_000268 [Naganishia friedmannii]|uniref:Uncharacterized protein n=1 Tax=Naganishia friedmannii TaxID=89922 RepID=A0ACC2WD08_9TREE|nr:hypothetical protein QFC21_000268 [Naganishia friedmannii]
MANMLSKPLDLITSTSVSALHLGVYVGTLAVCSCLGVVYSVVLSLIGQHRLNFNYLTARSFHYLCLPLVGVKIEVEGRKYVDEVFAKAKRG